MMKKDYSKPMMCLEVFTPQEYIASCPEDYMYQINPVTLPSGGNHVYMLGESCGGAFQGPVEPNEQPIFISKDAYPTIAAMINASQKWSLGFKDGSHYNSQTGYDYYSISSSSNDTHGNINSSNVSEFHATICGDHASQNALIILDASVGIVKNRS